MKRSTALIAGLVAVLMSASSAIAQSPAPEPAVPASNPWWQGYAVGSRLVGLPDGRKLNLYCEGSGSPTILLESGLGDGAETWRNIQDQLARTTRVCAYDRAGYGASTPGPLPRDAAALATDLELLVDSAKLKPPYVVVAHSLGGVSARLFAARRLRQIAGVVMIETAVENQNQRFDTVVPGYTTATQRQYLIAKPCAGPNRPAALTALCVHAPRDVPPELAPAYVAGRGPDYFAAMLSENNAMAQPVSAPLRPLGDVPLIVLTRGEVHPNAPLTEVRPGAMFEVWNQMHDEVARLSTIGVNRVIPKASHAIQASQPQVAVDTILEVIQMAKRKGAGRPR